MILKARVYHAATLLTLAVMSAPILTGRVSDMAGMYHLIAFLIISSLLSTFGLCVGDGASGFLMKTSATMAVTLAIFFEVALPDSELFSAYDGLFNSVSNFIPSISDHESILSGVIPVLIAVYSISALMNTMKQIK